MASVVVIGGGLAGLATALFTSRRGHEVVLVERGAPPPDGSADALAHWDRRGVAQAHFAHYFRARSTRVVREEATDLLKVSRSRRTWPPRPSRPPARARCRGGRSSRWSAARRLLNNPRGVVW